METEEGRLYTRSPATIKHEDESGNEEYLRSPDTIKQEPYSANEEMFSFPLEIKQEAVSADEDGSVSGSLGDIEVKEEINIVDEPCVGDGYIKSSGEFKFKKKLPLLLSIVDEEGNVLEEYVEENGILTPLMPTDSAPPKKRKGRSPKKPKGHKIKKAPIKPMNRQYLRRDIVFQFENYSCKLCKNMYKGRISFKKHLNQHYTTVDNVFQCSLCWYKTGVRGHITRHIMETHHLFEGSGPSERLFACTLCDKRFLYKKDLERHMFMHTRTGPLKCSVCNFSHIVRSVFERHVISHTGGSLPVTKKKHPDELYECHHCGYKSECKSALRTHIERHLGVSRFKCDLCSYACIFKGDMAKHATTHSDIRPFSCSTCLKTFRRRSHLVSHLKSKSSCQLEIKRAKKERLAEIGSTID